ncbi:MAG TPA: murein L,D-transpeptidase catalytic domain family protein [Chitinophagales bacterium]|nr:murein L,D-transpeptidase catalytic domain family protein [Chitinophagales bacterium]
MKNTIIARIMYPARRLVLAISLLSLISSVPYSKSEDNVEIVANAPAQDVYVQAGLEHLGLNRNVYNTAYKGWLKLKRRGEISRDILSICDFTQSSSKERLYVIDMAAGKVLYHTLVAHGKNTGVEYAKYFSNQPQSLESSLGFYVTGNTYQGTHGLALVLEGKEHGFNDKAEERGIVMHGADYVSHSFISKYGTLGRSWGCPAVSTELHEQIINTIKGGSCLFIYYPDKQYLSASSLIH